MTSSLQSRVKERARRELERRRQARAGLLDFTTYTKPDYSTAWYHARLAAALDRFILGDIRRLMVFMPPQHGKSELVSRRLPSYLLGRIPAARIIACSYTADLASKMNRDCQRIIESDRYRRLFPGVGLSGKNIRTLSGQPLRNSDEFETIGADGKLTGGYYKSAGVGGGITGRSMDYGIIDDPIKGREAADSPTQRENVWEWYTGDFLSRIHGDTRILITATRWHPEDLPGRLLRQMEDDPAADRWEVVCFPAICEADGDGIGSPRKEGEPLWPERHPLSELETKRAASPYDWYSLYQQQPRNPGDTEWPASYFDGPGFWFDDWPDLNAFTLRLMALDPSKGVESKVGDYQALILWGRTADGVEYVEADLGKRPMTAALAADGVTELGEGMVETCLDRAARFRPEGLALEVNGFQQLLKVPFRMVMKKRGLELTIHEVENTVNKLVRIRRLGAPLSEGKMRFRRTSGTRLLVEQLKQFPTADHDDGPDALEMVRRKAMELWNNRGPRGPSGWRV